MFTVYECERGRRRKIKIYRAEGVTKTSEKRHKPDEGRCVLKKKVISANDLPVSWHSGLKIGGILVPSHLKLTECTRLTHQTALTYQ